MLLLDQGRNIQIEGAAGAFDKEFRAMEDNLEEIRKIIDGAGVSTIDVEELENMLKEIRYSNFHKFWTSENVQISLCPKDLHIQNLFMP